ncbi:hypothetical protein BVC80_209g25 [Macleaya cordata]|uniref:Uncharacterized protein n=1 Tax=Macleaya cordata TaxID=56857 RepID=A0A200QCX9_MACCD|nr:hypothetical protein BVC80_209g25 [Macleaya cordata]
MGNVTDSSSQTSQPASYIGSACWTQRRSQNPFHPEQAKSSSSTPNCYLPNNYSSSSSIGCGCGGGGGGGIGN